MKPNHLHCARPSTAEINARTIHPKLRSAQEWPHPRPKTVFHPKPRFSSTPGRDRRKNSSTPNRKQCSQNGYRLGRKVKR
ncbi:hypothetical protein FCV25MIE_27815 [Fagus crenata]